MLARLWWSADTLFVVSVSRYHPASGHDDASQPIRDARARAQPHRARGVADRRHRHRLRVVHSSVAHGSRLQRLPSPFQRQRTGDQPTDDHRSPARSHPHHAGSRQHLGQSVPERRNSRRRSEVAGRIREFHPADRSRCRPLRRRRSADDHRGTDVLAGQRDLHQPRRGQGIRPEGRRRVDLHLCSVSAVKRRSARGPPPDRHGTRLGGRHRRVRRRSVAG